MSILAPFTVGEHASDVRKTEKKRGISMFAAILFEFAGQSAHREYFIFKLPEELGVICKGDIVVVEGFNPGETRLGIVIRAFPKYYRSSKVRQIYLPGKRVLRKAHKNSLINLVKKRYDIVKGLEVSKEVYEKYKKDYRDNHNKTPEEVRRRLMRNIIVSSEDLTECNKEIRVFIFGNMKIVLKDNIVIDLIPLNRQKTMWVKPTALEQIALEYINKMENQNLILV